MGTHFNVMCRKGLNIAAYLGFKDKGPFPVKDSFGMLAAIIILQLSLKPRKDDTHLQFRSIRKFRSAVSNVYHMPIEGLKATVMAKDTTKLMVTECPKYGTWFKKFMTGCHKRMGETVRPDRALSSSNLVEILNIMEEEWDTSP
jgi:hypothetical protein